MTETCEYDTNPVSENGMCEDCNAEDEYMRTCGGCYGTAIVIQGSVNAYYECTACGARWL